MRTAPAHPSGDSRRLKRLASTYNQLINLFWSLLNLVPLVWYCSVEMDLRVVFVFSAISLLTGFLPRAFFNAIRLGNSPAAYNRIGIRLVRRFTQDGDWVNGLIRRKYPDYKVVRPQTSLNGQIQKAYYFEKFHFILLTYFVLTIVHTVVNLQFVWTITLFINNLIYNVYPVFLLQYTRLRLETISRR